MIWVNKRIRHYLKPMFRPNDVLSGWILWAYFWLVRSLVRRYSSNNTLLFENIILKVPLYLTEQSPQYLLVCLLNPLCVSRMIVTKSRANEIKTPVNWLMKLIDSFVFVQITTILINWSTTGCNNNKCSSENKNFRRYQHHIIC